ncbi:YaeQ family protein [Thalassotalea atypica]|uniref:YaeQ family protein n=1 Tax=Thalassotalea atypica TaxID=2054316 RepID=UPI0025737389|nr:YaeQ family protein [Thalassotalea atypica]
MALKATIFKIDLSISDMDRNYYAEHSLTIARHPSENDQRMMLRVLAFIFNASDTLTFTKGLSEVEDPDLWQKNLHDGIELWIELGQPSEQRIKKGCNQAQHMMVYSYCNGAFDKWWQKEQSALNQRKNLSVITIDETIGEQLSALVNRQMHIQCTLSEGQAWLTIGEQAIELTPNILKNE